MSKPTVPPKAFWEYTIQAREGDVSMTWCETALGERALQEGKCLYNYSINGHLPEGVDMSALLKVIEDEGLWLFRRKFPSRNRTDDEYLYVNQNTAVWVDFTNHNRSLRTSIYSLDEEQILRIKKVLKQHCENKAAKKGKVFVLVSTQQGMTLQEFGVAGEDFIEGNYRPEVVEKYRHVVKDLNDPDPCGRIAILDGPPGTGKTHMVRALLNEVPEATFILIQAGSVTDLGSPNFISVLMEEQRKDQPMILVLEDADECLSSRKADNISAISALLNFSDGIFGALLDMRIVATTNIDLRDLDKAVMRPGRLCRRIEVTLLDATQAQAVHHRLKGGSGPFVEGHFYSLGEIYTIAKGSESPAETDVRVHGKKLKTVGFQTQRSDLADDGKGLKKGQPLLPVQAEVVPVGTVVSEDDDDLADPEYKDDCYLPDCSDDGPDPEDK